MDCHFRLPREDEPGSVVTAYVGARVRATVSTQVRSLEPSSVTKKMSSCESADLMIGLDMGHFDPIVPLKVRIPGMPTNAQRKPYCSD